MINRSYAYLSELIVLPRLTYLDSNIKAFDAIYCEDGSTYINNEGNLVGDIYSTMYNKWKQQIFGTSLIFSKVDQ